MGEASQKLQLTVASGLVSHSETQSHLLAERAFEMLEALEPEIEWLANIPVAGTRRFYKTAVAQFMAFWGIDSAEKLRAVRLPHVIAWRDSLLDAGKAVSTVKSRLSALSDLFKHLVMAQERTGVTENPVRDIKQKKLVRATGTTPTLSEKQVRMVLDAPPEGTLQGLRDRAIVSVGFHEGPRRHEIARLKVKDWGENQGYPSIFLSRKGGREGWIAVHPETAKRISLYLDATGHRSEKNAPLFLPVRTTKPGLKRVRHLHAQQINRIFKRWLDAAGFDRRTRASHTMRKTCGTTALKNGAAIEAVQFQFGHADARTTGLYDGRKQLPENSAAFHTSYPTLDDAEAVGQP